ncbi:galectin-7 [Mesocricetus auratus]|uniref:Galectin n=1 Tax=Mesocricetus auratus TaxID=10036 RepID=A0ABM2WI76_MESAU|nr:galectin-7 [Mesocricetus auratus]
METQVRKTTERQPPGDYLACGGVIFGHTAPLRVPSRSARPHCFCVAVSVMAGSATNNKTPLLQGVRTGTVMRIRGVVPEQAGRFHINLLCSEEQEADAALHFNPRLDTSEVVFNTKEQGKWGREERGSGIPFQRGQPFEVLIITTEEGFKAVVGDKEYLHFQHRMPPARVRLVEVGGDVQLHSVNVF